MLTENELLKPFSDIGMAAWLLQTNEYKIDSSLKLGAVTIVDKKIISKDLINIIANMIEDNYE